MREKSPTTYSPGRTVPVEPRPVKISGRAELWVMPSRSEKDTTRMIAVFTINRKTKMNCSCPAGQQVPPQMCHHVKRVWQEREREKMVAGVRKLILRDEAKRKRGRSGK